MVAIQWFKASSLAALGLISTCHLAGATLLGPEVHSTATISQDSRDSLPEPTRLAHSATLTQTPTRTQPGEHLEKRRWSPIPDIPKKLGGKGIPFAEIHGDPPDGSPGWYGDAAPLPTQRCYVHPCWGVERCDPGYEYRIWGKDYRIRPDGLDPITRENALVNTLIRHCKVEDFFGFWWMGPDGTTYDRYQWLVQFKWAPREKRQRSCITEAILLSGGRIGQTNHELDLVTPDICTQPEDDRDEVKTNWSPWKPYQDPKTKAPRDLEFAQAPATFTMSTDDRGSSHIVTNLTRPVNHEPTWLWAGYSGPSTSTPDIRTFPHYRPWTHTESTSTTMSTTYVPLVDVH